MMPDMQPQQERGYTMHDPAYEVKPEEKAEEVEAQEDAPEEAGEDY